MFDYSMCCIAQKCPMSLEKASAGLNNKVSETQAANLQVKG